MQLHLQPVFQLFVKCVYKWPLVRFLYTWALQTDEWQTQLQNANDTYLQLLLGNDREDNTRWVIMKLTKLEENKTAFSGWSPVKWGRDDWRIHCETLFTLHCGQMRAWSKYKQYWNTDGS